MTEVGESIWAAKGGEGKRRAAVETKTKSHRSPGRLKPLKRREGGLRQGGGRSGRRRPEKRSPERVTFRLCELESAGEGKGGQRRMTAGRYSQLSTIRVTKRG